MESKKHLLLKEIAKQILLEKGFKESEIFYGYQFDNKKIDCVGISKNNKVAIECGNLNGENRLNDFKKFFNTVIHIPYIFKTCLKTRVRITIMVTEEQAQYIRDKSINLSRFVQKKIDEMGK